MNDGSEDEKYISTPERKRDYIQRWLEDNPHANVHFSTNSAEKTPPDSPITGKACTSPIFIGSPILGGKRSATSPIIGSGRNSTKRIKVIKKLNVTSAKKTLCTKSQLDSENDTNESCHNVNLPFKKDLNDLLLSKTVKIECDKGNVNSITTKYVNTENNAILQKNINFDVFSKRPRIAELASQIIESASSDETNIENNEAYIQEINSETDRTASDLIEDISTQLVLEPHCEQNNIILSQVISNPSSNSSEPIDDIHVLESVVNPSIEYQQSLETFTPTDQIDSVSTSETKVDFSKTSYILHCTAEKPKRRKNPKKGSLLESLLTTMGKEKSNVNLLRHQLLRKPTSISEKPFLLLQVIEHLPMMNETQLLKCLLLEDTMNLLNITQNHKNQCLITVMNIPEISCTINTNQKPILKVYEPWTILDRNQLFLQISRFIALPSADAENCDMSGYLHSNDIKLVREFYCPCIDEKIISNNCDSKFSDCLYNTVKMVCTYK